MKKAKLLMLIKDERTFRQWECDQYDTMLRDFDKPLSDDERDPEVAGLKCALAEFDREFTPRFEHAQAMVERTLSRLRRKKAAPPARQHAALPVDPTGPFHWDPYALPGVNAFNLQKHLARGGRRPL